MSGVARRWPLAPGGSSEETSPHLAQCPKTARRRLWSSIKPQLCQFAYANLTLPALYLRDSSIASLSRCYNNVYML
eukprot:935374-Prorocentrum_minimum.AAC.2